MKFTGIILSSLFTVIFLSCNSGLDGTMVMLKQAEQCMEAYPDSALQLLNGIHNPDELAKKERAEYLLLLTQARDKNYMDLSLLFPLLLPLKTALLHSTFPKLLAT